MITTIFIIIFLLVANAFFVAAEFALVKAKSFRIVALAEQGSATAIKTQKIQSNLEAYLAACQLGITMASLGLGWVGEPAVAAVLEPLFTSMGLPEELLHTLAFLIGFIVFSSLHIVVGEQVPKTFAIRQPEPVSLWIAYPLHWFYLLAFPLNWLLNKASGGILSFFNVEEATHADVFTDDELKDLINVSEVHGNLETEKAAMLQNLFEFDTRTVEKIMVPRTEVSVLDINNSLEENITIINESQHSRYPVIDGDADHIVGMLLVKDLFNQVMGGNTAALNDLRSLIREPLAVPETQRIRLLFDEMRKQTSSHMAFIIDEYGNFAGIVTMEDLLEEIVGEIADELDIDNPEDTLQLVDGHFECDGLLALSDVERALNIEFPSDLDANTLSGLFMVRLSRMPERGDEIEEAGYRFSSLTVERRRVGRVRIDKLPEPDDSENLITEPVHTD